MEAAATLIKGQQVQPVIPTDLVTIGPGENAKADQYEYVGNC